MRVTAFLNRFLVITTFSMLAACAKKEMQGPAVSLAGLSFKAANNPGLTADLAAVINDNNIVVKLPAAADIRKLVASYELANPETVIYLGKQPQDNGVSVVDFSNPMELRLKGRQSSKSYNLTVTKTASFTRFGFTKDDNPGVLTQDYYGTINGVEILIELPYGTDFTNLKPSFETTAGTTVKYNGAVETSGSAFHNFTSAVQYGLTDADTPIPVVFNITVDFVKVPVWHKVNEASWPVETSAVGAAKIAIHPITNHPYIVFQLAKDAAGTTLPAADKKVAVITNNGSGWQYVGSASGFSDGDGRDPAIAFDKNGVLYVSYRDYSGSVSAPQNRVTVKKLDNGTWVTVGTNQFTPTKADYMSLGVDEANRPWISLIKQDAAADASGLERRQLYTMKFENNAWSMVTPPSKVSSTGTELIFANNKLYLTAVDRTTATVGVSVFENNNGQWTPVGAPGFTYNSKQSNFGISLAVAPDGTKYLAYQSGASTARTNYVMTYTNGTNSWDKIGDDVSSNGADEKFSLAVDPDGKLYFAYIVGGGLEIRTFDQATNNWFNQKTTLINEATNAVDMAMTSNGVPYVVGALSGNNKIQVYKFAIPTR